jgi:pyruvate/2-oxoglutarate dehydrogenase complex dihydrolipoamide dehydrogenase (E3) component
MAEHFDAIIIGTGQSGPSLAGRFDQAGRKVAVIERHRVGGTCVNTGCIPTKTLVASARAAYVARRAADFGVELGGPVRVDMKRVKARKDELAGESNQGVTQWLEGMKHVTFLRGHARFEGPRVVSVEGRQLEADRIFLNVGARASIPKLPGLEGVPYLTNSTLMDVDFLPPHLVVLGGSYVGLEFAQMYRRFGSAVTVIEKGPRVLSRDDADVAQAVREILEKEGVAFRLGAEVERVEKRGDGVAIHVKGGGAVEGSHVLVALGRTPNTDDLGLDRAGVEVDARGFIQVDEQLRTRVPGIWALGDCNGRGAFTHTSYNDYEIVAANLFDGESRKVSDRHLAYALYVDPPLGRVGMTEQQARESGRRVLMTKLAMSRVTRARTRSETDGFIKILVDADSKEILGAAILGTEGDEVIHVLIDVMYAKAPYTVVQRAMHIHPTVSELLPTALGELKPLE